MIAVASETQPLSRAMFQITRAMAFFGGIVLAAMMFLTAADVILRYIFNAPITSAYELTELMMAIVVFFGMAYVSMRKEHIRIDFVINKFPLKGQALLDSITTFIGTCTLFVITWRLVSYSFALKAGGDVTTILRVPIYPFIWLVSISMAVYCVASVFEFSDHLARLLKKESLWARFGLLFVVVIVVLLFALPVMSNFLHGASPITVGTIDTCMLIVLMLLGMNIGLSMAVLGFIGMSYISGLNASISMMGSSPFTTAASYGFSVIPLFMLMGVFAFYSGMMREFYTSMHKWLGHLPGGLAMATICGCAGFAAVCGSSTATVATLGTAALPEMKRYKYHSSLATGCIAAGGCLGVMIPPSTLFIIYGILTEQSIGKLFLAGFIPGITEALFYIIVIYILCKRNPQMGPIGESTSLKDKITSLKGTWGVIILFILVIGGIYAGVFTPTEAAGIGAFGPFSSH